MTKLLSAYLQERETTKELLILEIRKAGIMTKLLNAYL